MSKIDQLAKQAADMALRLAALPADGLRNDLEALNSIEQLAMRILRDVSAKGQALLEVEHRRREMVALAPGETKERDLTWMDWSFPRAISSDGKLVLFEEEGAGGGKNYSVYVRGSDGSPAVRLGDGYGIALSPGSTAALSALPSGLNALIGW